MSPKSLLPNATEVPSSVTYIRFDWADVEPNEGVYDWRIIDRALADALKRGATVSMRVMTANAHSKGTYSSPKWLFDLGCKSYEYTVGGDDPTSGGKRLDGDQRSPSEGRKHMLFKVIVALVDVGPPDALSPSEFGPHVGSAENLASLYKRWKFSRILTGGVHGIGEKQPKSLH